MAARRGNRQATRRTERTYRVFVSHATADKWLARVFCEKLEAVGAATFRDDRDINGGDDIPEAIFTGIKRSQELLVPLSPSSVGRQWVLLEIGAALGWSKRMRIVVLRCHVEVDPVPSMLKAKKSFDINEMDVYLDEVRSRVEAYRR